MKSEEEIQRVINDAYQIAVSDLRSNYGKLGIYAGPRNHHEYWARDSFFASLGSLVLGDFDIVKKNLDLFSLYQSSIGQIPLRVEERFHAPGVIGLNIYHKKPTALFKPSQPWAGEVIDSNPLYLILASEYIKMSGDLKWLLRNEDHLMKAVSWLVGKFDEKNLITEGFNSGWADFTFKRGNVLYTNILVWKAFKLLCETLPEDGARFCIAQTKRLEEAIRKYFWYEKGGYFIDHLGKHGFRHKVFASDGNLLAVLFNFSSKIESERIFTFIDNHNLNKVPVPIYFKGLEWKHKFLNSLIFPEYNTDYTFLWWGSLACAARLELRDYKKTRQTLYTISKIILKYNTVPEIVDNKGFPLNKWYYKSEKRAAWSAGTFVFAYSKFTKLLNL